MNRRWTMVGVLGFMLWTITPVPAAESATLTELRYSVQAGYSRVTLLFDGEVRYSSLGSDGVVRLGFSHAGVGIPMKARHQVLRSGHVTGIDVTPLPGDSMVVALTVQAGANYRCILPASGNTLVVDVVPAGGQSAMPQWTDASTEKRVPVAPAPAKSIVTTVRVPVRQTRDAATTVPPPKAPAIVELRPRLQPVVDIRGMVRDQVQAASAAMPQQRRAQQAVIATLTPASALLISVIVALLLTGGSAALALAFRRSPATPVAPARNAGKGYAEDTSAFGERESARNTMQPAEPDACDETDDAHETSLQLARTFRRGSDEITLARRMQDHLMPKISAARMEETLARAATTDQRLQQARKLGVGRGEMELALKLRTLRAAEKKKEGSGS